ncbi:MAG: hypothetical protein Q8P13_00035 [bacterium]|nr:hypothetical protein [bacterium]
MDNKFIDEALQQIRQEILKAAETTATFTHSAQTRSVFSPENLDEKIKFLVPIDTPVRNRIPRAKGKGQVAEWKKMTSALHSKSHPSTNVDAGTGTAIAFADAGAPGETTQTYSDSFAAYKLLGRKLEVGGLALAASKGRDGQPDMQTSREQPKMYELMLGEEELLIAGDLANSALEFDGLNKQITTNSGNCAFITASGVGAWCRTLYTRGGDPTLLLASALQIQALADDLEHSGGIHRAVVTQNEVAGITGGFALSRLVNPVTQSIFDIKPSRFVGYGGLLLTEKSPGGESYIDISELIPVSRVDVPSGNFSYISFILEALALRVWGEPMQLEFCTLA